MKRGVVKFTFLGIGLFILLFLILFIPGGKSNPDVGVTNCTNLTTAGERYNLTNDIYNNQIADACINIFSPNVTLNCNGHYIFSIQNYSGVYVNATNATINGCNITIGSLGNTGAKGIFLNGVSSSNSTIFNNRIFGDSYAGIYLVSSSNNNLTNNNATSNSSIAIFLQSSLNNNLISNIGISNSSYGIYLSSSSNNTLISNTGTSNSSSGLYLESSLSNLLISNTGISNSSGGINLLSSTYNNLRGNTGISNSNAGMNIAFSGYSNLTNNTGISTSSIGIILSRSHNLIAINNTGTSNLGMGISLSYAQNDTLQNNTGTSNSAVGINLGTSGSNVLISNLGISTSNSGIYLQSSSSNNTLTSNTGVSNSYHGIYLDTFSNNNTLISNTGMSNSSTGISLTSSSNNTLTSNTGISNLSAGIYLSFSNNNTINNSVSNNNKYGLYISNSNGTIVINLTAKNNSLYGIFLERVSYNNIITNSFIQLNNGSAFALNSTGTAPQANYFYNNYFNNSVQYSNVSTASINFFNITKTLGTNIVGGTYLAGNYWAAPNGSGFSQTCTASTDGICDTSYNFDGINYDYLPLTCIESWSCTSWSTCTGTQTRTCSDANLCQTYKYKPVESQACTIADLGGHNAPSSSGGSSFVSQIVNVTPNKPIEIIINNPSMDLNSLILNVKKEVANSSVNITKINSSTYSLITGLPIGKLYQAFEIEPGISNSNIVNATINFRINKTWLADNNITFHSKGSRFWLLENDIVGNIILYRNPEGNSTWMPLATNYSYQDNQSYHFYSYSKGFSTFAIFVNKYDCLPNSARCDNNEVQLCLGNSTWLVTEHCQYGCGDRKCAGSFFVSSQFKFLSIVIVIAVVVIGLILIFYKKKRKVRKEVRKKKREVRKKRKNIRLKRKKK